MQPPGHLPQRFALRPVYFGLTLALSGFALDALACDPQAGRLSAIEGRVEVRTATSKVWQTASARQILCPGDQVAVRGPGRAAVVLSQDVLVRLDQNTTLTLPPAANSSQQRRAWTRAWRGARDQPLQQALWRHHPLR